MIVYFLVFSLIYIFIHVEIYLENLSFSNGFKCENIAHGCGLYKSYKYTNALEAFQNSYEKGYRKIEIDLSVTKDNHIVGCHDWNLFKNYTRYNGYDDINYDYIIRSRILHEYHAIYDFMLYNLLKNYSDVYIVTDKITNYRLLKKYSRITERLYVEVSSYRNYKMAKSVGLANVLINVVNTKDILYIQSNLNKNQSIFGIIIGPKIFYSMKSYLLELFKKNIVIYVYDVNNMKDINRSFCKYVNGFYID